MLQRRHWACWMIVVKSSETWIIIKRKEVYQWHFKVTICMFFAFKKISKDSCMQNNPQANVLSPMLLKEICCHSEAGLEISPEIITLCPCPKTGSTLSLSYLTEAYSHFTERDVIIYLGNLLQCLIILILRKFFQLLALVFLTAHYYLLSCQYSPWRTDCSHTQVFPKDTFLKRAG